MHFAQMEGSLLAQAQQSLGKSLLTKVEQELARNANALAFQTSELTAALQSDEPNVRIAAAYAIARLTPNENRGARIAALESNLADADAEARFWTAIALERIGSASSRGAMELHVRTLPVFLETLRGGPPDLRLASLIELAMVAPECINTNRQLRILPKVRSALVDACRDEDGKIRAFARELLSTFRWQRFAYESQRMRRHYLAQSFELESMAAQTLALEREFADPPSGIRSLLRRRSLYDVSQSMTYVLPTGTATEMSIAVTKAEAKQIVEDDHRRVYTEMLKLENLPPWKVESVDEDADELYFAATEWARDREPALKMIYVIPRPSMLSAISAPPHSWFEPIHQAEQYVWPATRPSSIQPRTNVHVTLGDVARRDRRSFTAA